MTAATTAETKETTMSTARDSGRVYALLAGGTTAEIREARPEDLDAVQAMHEAMALENIYLRFFSYSRRSAETEARRICREPDPGTPGSAALLALRDGELAGVASYAELIGHPGQARSRSPWPTTCTTWASPPCCSSTWSRWLGAARSPPSPPKTLRAAAVGLPARRRPAQGHRARPEPGHRQATRGVRDGRGSR
jgi:hypothetical protein